MRVVAVVAVLLLITWFAVGQAPAPAGGTQKIAVVNTDRVLVETSEGKAADAQLRAKFAPREREIETRRQELEKMQADLQAKAATLPQAEQQRRALDLQQRQKQLERMAEDAQTDANAAQQESFGKIAKQVQAVVQKFGAENGYHLIMDGAQAGTLYAGPSADITAQIIAAYDKAHPVAAAPAAPATPPAAKPPAAKK